MNDTLFFLNKSYALWKYEGMRQVYTANLNETKELVVLSQFSLGTSESEADERYLCSLSIYKDRGSQ